jgi:hypothetical protein
MQVTWFGALFHAVNFAAPAAWVALVLVLLARFSAGGRSINVLRQFAVLWAVGLGVALLGLWWFERDGKMATYAAMVLSMGTVAWAGFDWGRNRSRGR